MKGLDWREIECEGVGAGLEDNRKQGVGAEVETRRVPSEGIGEEVTNAIVASESAPAATDESVSATAPLMGDVAMKSEGARPVSILSSDASRVST